MAQPIKQKSGIYQLRRRVPQPLQPVLGLEYKRSLDTKDPQEAKRRFVHAWAESEAAFALAKARAGAAAKLTDRDAQVLAGRWMKQELAAVEASGNFRKWLVEGRTRILDRGDTYDEYQPLLDFREALDGDDDDAEQIVLPYIRATLQAASLALPPPRSAEYRALRLAFVAHLYKLSDVALARLEGDWQAKPDTLAGESLRQEVDEQARKVPTLLAAFEEYAQDRLLNDGETRSVLRTNASYRGFMEEFSELCGNLPVSNITPAVIRDYRALVAKLPVKGVGRGKLTAHQKIAKAEVKGLPLSSPGTISNKLRALSAVLSKAKRTGHLGGKGNPVIEGEFLRDASRSLRVKAVRRRKHYVTSELQTIFGSPVFSADWQPPKANFGKAWYWLPLLLYYTGARLEEVAQLAARDVCCDEGVYYLNILNKDDEDDEGKGVKTDGSRRDVPLHPDLIALGFVDYAKSVPQEGQLFPSLKKSPAGYYGTNFAKRWARYLRGTVGLASTAHPCHGFRHTFKTLCRAAEIDEDVQDAITGHLGENRVARSYGEMPLTRLAADLAAFPSAPLPQLRRDHKSA
jgi:integrase